MLASRLPLAIVATVAVMGACRAPSATPGAPAPVIGEAPVRDSLVGPWTIGPALGEREHSFVVEGTLVSRVDTLERTDTLRLRLRAATSRVAGGGATRIAGMLLAYELSTGDTMPFIAPPGLLLPVPVSATLRGDGAPPELADPVTGACSPAGAALQPLRDLWASPPTTLRAGQEWGDSATYRICRDSVPITVRTTRRFQVLNAERYYGALVVRVARDSRTTLEGEGSQFGEPIRIAGEGTGWMELLLSLEGGEIVRADGEGELLLRMTGRRRSQELRQRTRTTIASP